MCGSLLLLGFDNIQRQDGGNGTNVRLRNSAFLVLVWMLEIRVVTYADEI
jgi:hypothetical protein